MSALAPACRAGGRDATAGEATRGGDAPQGGCAGRATRYNPRVRGWGPGSRASMQPRSMKYKLFVFDLDETLWTVSEGLCSLVRPPFRLVSPDRLETNEGFWVELKPGVHNLFRFLKAQDRYVSLASRNDAEPTLAILEAFGLAEFLDFPQLCWRPKQDSIEKIIQGIQKRDKVTIRAEEVFFLDDWPENVQPVRKWGATALLYGQDVLSHDELIGMLR